MRIRENATKRRLAAGGTVFGIFIPFGEPGLVELCGIAGFDFVIIDMEHGAIDAPQCENLIRAAEVADVTPVVRVSTTEPAAILRLLDAGAQGIMAPHVNSREDAARAVAAVRYPPLGRCAVLPAHRKTVGPQGDRDCPGLQARAASTIRRHHD